MFDIDRWREIFQSVNKNRLRSILSGFTVAFAILLFTLLFGIGNGLQNTFKEQFAGDATNSIYVGSGRTTKPYKGLQSGRQIQFKNDDYDYFESFLFEVYYDQSDIEVRDSIIPFLKQLFDTNRTFTKSDLEMYTDMYKVLERSLDN